MLKNRRILVFGESSVTFNNGIRNEYLFKLCMGSIKSVDIKYQNPEENIKNFMAKDLLFHETL